MELSIENNARVPAPPGIKIAEGSIPCYAGGGSGLATVVRATSLSSCAALADRNPCVLNFANNDIAGGGFRLAGNTQEEQLLKTTTLGSSLMPNLYPIDHVVDMYRWYDYKRLACIYSSAHVVRDESLEPVEPYAASFITCAAINNPRTCGPRYSSDADRTVTRRKIALVLDAAIHNGHDVLVAGAWGRGAFGNPEEIYSLWLDEISTRGIDVVFPVLRSSDANALASLGVSVL